MTLAQEADSSEWKDLDDIYCHTAYIFQKVFSITIDDNFPVARLNILREEANKEYEKNKEKEKDGKSN